MVLYQSKYVHFTHCNFTENKLSAVKVVGSDLTFSGSVTFANNTAPLGAALILQQKSVVTQASNSSLMFVGNYATSVGGAVYIDTNTFYRVDVKDYKTISLHSVCSFQFQGNGPVFVNNSAGNGGDVVYGGHMGLTTTTDGNNCLQQFKHVSEINQTPEMSFSYLLPAIESVCL